MSHIRSDGSRFFRESRDFIQRCAQLPSPMINGLSSSPASDRRYSTEPFALRDAVITPARCNSLSRLDSSAGDIFGSPRLRSLKRELPQSSSRTTSVVQRLQRISDAIDTGQNWP